MGDTPGLPSGTVGSLAMHHLGARRFCRAQAALIIEVLLNSELIIRMI